MDSSECAACNNDLSSLCFAKSCMPTGKPFDTAYGTEIEGIPVRFDITVLISTWNNAIGSSIFSPILNGRMGTVGAIR